MRASLLELVGEVRKVWAPPAARPWSHGDVAIVKLLKAIEDAPGGQLQDRQVLERLFIAIASDFDQTALVKVRARIEEICR